MKRICFLMLSFFITAACDDNKKITLYLKDKKELKVSALNEGFITHINFLFVIDASSSMRQLKKALARNIKFFLDPILNEYPYHNYNFAFTTMAKKKIFNHDQPLLQLKTFFNECDKPQNIRLKNSNIGAYLQYSYKVSKQSDIEGLLCFLNLNIKNITDYRVAEESYFQPLDSILDQSDTNFKEDFFGDGKILILFFISDAWQGVDYYKMTRYKPLDIRLQAAEELADKYINKFQQFLDVQNLRTYASIPSYELEDRCGERPLGDINYPFHVYKFIEKTNGIRVSLCEEDWGKNLSRISHNFLSYFRLLEVFLEDFPQIDDSMELYFNDLKIPYDYETGWFLNMEKLSIQLGAQFDWSYYLARSSKNLSESEIKILYHPLNLEILQEGSEK